MELHVPDYVRISVDGSDKTEYILNYQRKSSVCEIGDSFYMDFDSDYSGNLNPYSDVIIRELYDGSNERVLRGYITSIDHTVDDGRYSVQGSDKSIQLFDYFIHEQILANGESVDFWIDYIAGLAGLEVQFDASAQSVVSEGTPLGMQTAGDAIRELERIAAYYIKYDSDIDKLRVFRLDTSEPQITVTSALSAKRDLGTEKTRNVVKVYGGFRYDIESGESEQVFASARTDMDELIADKTVVVSNPGLNKQTFAYIVADRILNVVNSVDDVQTYMLEGFYPSIDVGDVGNISWNNKWNYDGSRIITSIQSSVSEEDGAITSLTFGEKCPRLSINLPPTPVFVSTISGGVGVSWNGGESFIPTNLGLTTSGQLNVHNIAVNSYGQGMIVNDDGIYRRPYFGSTWTKVPFDWLGTPENASEDDPATTISDLSPIKVVSEPTTFSTFHVITKNPNPSGEFGGRYWVYTTRNFGQSWSNWQAYVPVTGVKIYNAFVRDIDTAIDNNIYVAISSPGEFETGPNSVYVADVFNNNRSIRLGKVERGDTFISYPYSVSHGTSDEIQDFQVFSCPDNRDVAYGVYAKDEGSRGPIKFIIVRTTDGGSSWTEIYNEYAFGSSDTTRYHFLPGFQQVMFDYNGLVSGTVRIALFGLVVDENDSNQDTNKAITYYAHQVIDEPFGSSTTDSIISSIWTYADDDGFGTDPNGTAPEDKDWVRSRIPNFGKAALTYTQLGDNEGLFDYSVQYRYTEDGGLTFTTETMVKRWRYDISNHSITPQNAINFVSSHDGLSVGTSPYVLTYRNAASYIAVVQSDASNVENSIRIFQDTGQFFIEVDTSSDNSLDVQTMMQSNPATSTSAPLGHITRSDRNIYRVFSGGSSEQTADPFGKLFGCMGGSNSSRWYMLTSLDGISSLYFTSRESGDTLNISEEFEEFTNFNIFTAKLDIGP